MTIHVQYGRIGALTAQRLPSSGASGTGHPFQPTPATGMMAARASALPKQVLDLLPRFVALWHTMLTMKVV